MAYTSVHTALAALAKRIRQHSSMVLGRKAIVLDAPAAVAAK